MEGNGLPLLDRQGEKCRSARPECQGQLERWVLYRKGTWQWTVDRGLLDLTCPTHGMLGLHAEENFSLFAEEGGGQVQIGRRQLQVEPRHYYLVNPGDPYALTIPPGPRVRYVSVSLSTALWDAVLEPYGKAGNCLMFGSEPRPLRGPMQEVLQNFLDALSAGELLPAEEAMTELATLCLEIQPGNHVGWFNGKRPRALQDVRVRRAVEVIHDRYTESITMDDLLDASGLSRPHLFALFKAMIGVTPFDLLSTCRVERAKTLLRETDQSVEDIAHQVGYMDLRGLQRAFHRHAGASPSCFRS